MKAKEIAQIFIEKNKKFTKESSFEATKEMMSVFVFDFKKLVKDRKIGYGESLAALVKEFDKKFNAVNIILYRKYKTHLFFHDGFSLFLKDVLPDIHKDYLKYR